ncbi:nuclear pore protein-like protein [Colletotrichum chrysophilum]|uniref:Nuclear pore protein-like protein n=1 Tax=Colletotrichum chrysophilum TaxID=1836956 RepID=A0AAD9EH09_9PEZI|nr:nuclear pore protein-like protein [Colletotrichum chrysophilum]
MADTATAEIPIVDIPVADVSISSASEGDEYEDVTNSLWACLLAAMLALQVGEAYHFDTRGDLTLKVGGDQSAYEFVVCSRTLGRSSPVFQAMLFNGFTESKPSDGAAWNVQRPDDDPSPIFLILSIIHGHFQHVTRTLREKQLYEVLVVTEKYDMTKILNPLASTWFAPYEEIRFLGSDETFPLLWRVAAIGLKEVAFLETPTPDYRFSVEELSKDIRAMIIDLPEEHKECNPLPALRDEMQQLLDYAYTPVTDAHMQYLESQAKKTGIQDMPCGVIQRSRKRSREEKMSDDDSISADTAKEDEPEPVPRPFWECLKPATSTIECGKAFSFDPIGDLTLRVGEDVVAYEFISRPADAAWSASLPEDLPSAMFLVLSIIHGCFEHVPTSLSQIELCQTLVATEKYDMTKIVRPWATAWFAPYKNISKVSGNEILLWISWELGYADNFCWLAKDLLLSSPVNGNGQLIGQDGVVLSTYSYLEPPEILAGPYDLGRVALKKSSLTLPPHMCKALVFGSLAKEISKMLGQDVALMKKPIPHLQQSINYLLLMIDCMEVDVLAEHQACNPLPATQKVIRAVVESVTSPVKSLHLEYLKEQAKKTGV